MITTKTRVEKLKLNELVLDKSIQMRASLNRNAILDYAESYKAGEALPPIVVYYRWGSKHYVADGFHRVLALKKLRKDAPGEKKWTVVEAEIRDGTKRDAILYSAQANTSHGVRRTNEDKRKTIIFLLRDSEWRKWTDTTIASCCKVDPATVRKYRQWLTPNGSATKEEVRTYIDRSGRERTRTVPKPIEDPDLGAKIKHDLCPYCGQVMRTRDRK